MSDWLGLLFLGGPASLSSASLVVLMREAGCQASSPAFPFLPLL